MDAAGARGEHPRELGEQLGGRLSTTYQPRSSSTAAARLRPAPDIPVITSSSGSSVRGEAVVASSAGMPAGTVVGGGSSMAPACQSSGRRDAASPDGAGCAGQPPAPRSAATTASAVLGPMPGTAAISSGARSPQPRDRTEVVQQGGRAGRAEAGHLVQRRRRHARAPPLAVTLDREPVRLVAHPLQQVQALRAARQDHRVVLPRQPDLLEPLREPAQRHVVDAELVQRARGGGDLGRSAVDHDEVRRVGEAARACRRRRRDLAAAQRALAEVRRPSWATSSR